MGTEVRLHCNSAMLRYKLQLAMASVSVDSAVTANEQNLIKYEHSYYFHSTI